MLREICDRSNHCKRVVAARRRGTTMVECAIALPVMFIVLFALLDLGLAATRYNALAEAARKIGREAILHGSLAPPTNGTWGPGEYTGTVADSSPIVAAAHDMVPTMNPNDVSVQVTWPDNDNSPRDRVQVEVSYQHHPLIPGFCPWGTLNLHSAATMHIVN